MTGTKLFSPVLIAKLCPLSTHCVCPKWRQFRIPVPPGHRSYYPPSFFSHAFLHCSTLIFEFIVNKRKGLAEIGRS